MHVEFYRAWPSFPHTKMDGDDDYIHVSVHPNGPDEGGNYGFSITHVHTGRRHRAPIALQVEMFADSWRAYADLPEFFALLATMDESARPRDERATLDTLIPRLIELGWHDKTPEYAARHTHAPGCLTCGTHLPTPALTDMDERRIRSVVCEWLNEADVPEAQALSRKIAANLRPTIDASLRDR